MRHVINVIGEECEVTVSQQSKTVWTASGSIEGSYLSVKGRSANTALAAWADAARYRRARN